MRVPELIAKCREVLKDPKKTRYTDDLLIDYLNMGVQDFIQSTKSYKKNLYMALNDEVATYDFRPFSYEILRVEYNNAKVNSVTMDKLDYMNHNWREEVGEEVDAVIFDKLPRGVLTIYPRVRNKSSIVTYSGDFGIVTDININDIELADIPSIETVESSLDKYIKVIAVCKPEKVDLNTTDLVFNDILDSAHDTAMIFYVTSWCLRTDSDAGNRAYGAEQIKLYSEYVIKNTIEESYANNSAVVRTIPYNDGFL